MRRLVLLLASLYSLFVQARAQGMEVQLAPSAAVACMTPPMAQRGAPEYPFEAWKLNQVGRVRIELIFTGPDLEPEVNVLKLEGPAALSDVVKKYAAEFRVPCLQYADIPLRLTQDYVFESDTRKITWNTPTDVADGVRREQVKCMAAIDGSKAPEYPTWARRDAVAGNLLARVKFTAADQPPEVTTYAGSEPMRRLARAAEAWARKLRVPCLARPIDAIMTFKFRFEQEPPFGFRQITFMQFLRSVKDFEKLRANLDTTQMGCPFDVQLNYRQPHFPNRVGQIGQADARRQPVLDWLSTLVLRLKEHELDAVLGDDANFTIPCVKIDLKPKE